MATIESLKAQIKELDKDIATTVADQLKVLIGLRNDLSSMEKSVSVEVFLFGKKEQKPLYQKTRKKRRDTEKLIFSLIQKL